MQASTNDIILLNDELLKPISDENPAGDYLIYDPTYDRIKEALREDDPDLSRGVWEHDLKRADWREVHELCIGALRGQTRDIQVAGWLMQASTRLRGFDGFRESLQLLFEYCERFWDWLHPRDEEYRHATFEWMDRRLPEALGQVPLVRPVPEDRIFDWNELEATRKRGNVQEEEQGEEELLTTGRVERIVAATPTDVFADATRNLQEALETTRRLQSLLDDRMGSQAPTLKNLRDTETSIAEFNQVIWRDREPEPEPEVEPALVVHEETGEAANASAAPTGAGQVDAIIRNRADAYRQLLAAAEYLQKTEPHSPTPYLVRRAVTWGDMSLEELLTELVGESGNLLDLYRLLGMNQEGAA